jgi:hypothetical protein
MELNDEQKAQLLAVAIDLAREVFVSGTQIELGPAAAPPTDTPRKVYEDLKKLVETENIDTNRLLSTLMGLKRAAAGIT